MKAWYESSTPLVRGVVITTLGLMVVGSAVAVSYLKHREVQLYVTLDGLKKQYEQMLEEQGRLRLEEASWGHLAKIEDRATEELKMEYPKRTRRVVMH